MYDLAIVRVIWAMWERSCTTQVARSWRMVTVPNSGCSPVSSRNTLSRSIATGESSLTHTSRWDSTQVIQAGKSSTTALHGSTEDEQFFESPTVAGVASIVNETYVEEADPQLLAEMLSQMATLSGADVKAMLDSEKSLT